MTVIGRVLLDLRDATMSLRRAPGFTLIVLATLALCVGVNTALFTLMQSLLLSPLPYEQPDRLATVHVDVRTPRGSTQTEGTIDGATFLSLQANAPSLVVAAEGPAGYGVGANLTVGRYLASVVERRVSAGYFGVLRVRPAVGREFTEQEDRDGQRVALISHRLWVDALGMDTQFDAHPLTLRGDVYTVVGVLPDTFVPAQPVDVWTPLRPSPIGEGSGLNYVLIARLRDGLSWTRASTEVDNAASTLMKRHYGNQSVVSSYLVPLQQFRTAGLRTPLYVMMAAVLVVLFAGCLSIAGLLLARAGRRAREVAVRMAIGGSRWGIMRQLLLESALLSLGGCVLGVVAGMGMLSALGSLNPDASLTETRVLDMRVLAFTGVVALLVTVLCGLAPAIIATRVDVQGALTAFAGRAVAPTNAGWLRRALVASEVAVSLVLLIASGLLVRTFLHLNRLEPGFDPRNVIVATISLQEQRYSESAEIRRLFSQTLERIRRAPGVSDAGVSLGIPYTRLLNLVFSRRDATGDEIKGGITNVSYVTPGYLEALRVELKRGRRFGEEDSDTSAPVVIVNQEFVARYYRNVDPLQRRISLAGQDREIIGVVADARSTTPGFGTYRDPLVTPPIVYVPYTQISSQLFQLVHRWFAPSWVIRSSVSSDDVVATVRQALAAADPQLPIARLTTLEEVQAAALARYRLAAAVALSIGGLVALLSVMGIHGLIANAMAERRPELGIRLALGASRLRIVSTMVVPVVGLAVVGLAVGATAAYAGTRVLRSFLWGVTPTDPLTFTGMLLGLLVVATFASIVPVLRGLDLDPADTLRDG